jgi:hypothetical protein
MNKWRKMQRDGLIAAGIGCLLLPIAAVVIIILQLSLLLYLVLSGTIGLGFALLAQAEKIK